MNAGLTQLKNTRQKVRRNSYEKISRQRHHAGYESVLHLNDRLKNNKIRHPLPQYLRHPLVTTTSAHKLTTVSRTLLRELLL